MPASRNSRNGSGQGHGRPRQWLRILFTDHPKEADGSHHFGASSTGKFKVMCTACMEYHIALETEKQNNECLTGAWFTVSSREEIIAQLWRNPPEKTVVSTQGQTMRNHIKWCDQNSKEDRVRAANYSPSKTSSQPATSDAGGISLDAQTLATLLTTVASSSRPQAPASISLNSPVFEPHNLPDTSGSAIVHSFLESQGPFPSSTVHTPLSAVSSIGPSESASANGGSVVSRAPSRAGSMLLQSANQGPQLITWSEKTRQDFKRRLLRLTALGGFALSWVENPEFHLFCDTFLPGCPRLTRKILMTVLRDTVDEFRAKTKAKVRGKEVTLQSDGWTGVNNRHLNAFMITCNRRVHTVRVNDTTRERKTADKLLAQIEAVYKDLQDTSPNGWNTQVTSVCTDASGDARKARKDFVEKYPHVIVLDCYAHQINLVVGDLLRSKAQVLAYSEDAIELIGWLCSKTRVLAELPLAVLRAVITRWTAHYVAFRRLLQLYPKLLSLARDDPFEPEATRILVTGTDAKARSKAEDMIRIINNTSMWRAIALLCTYLEPLAIAANITQGVTCRPDQVLLTFGFLVQKYSDVSMSTDITARDAVLASLEKRWAKSDQEIFVAAILVNPFYQTAPFKPARYLSEANVSAMLSRLYTRMFQEQPPPEFTDHLSDFFKKQGFFENLPIQVKDALTKAQKNGSEADPISVLQSFHMLGLPDSDSPFIRFACRLLSISANSASCERLFSLFGNTLTKKRNRLSTSTLVQLSEVTMHVRDEHLAHGTKTRLKRQFEARAPPPDPSAPPRPDINTARSDSRASLARIISEINILPITILPPPVGPTPRSSQPREPSEFADIAAQHIQSVSADDEITVVRDPGAPVSSTSAMLPQHPDTSAPSNSKWVRVKLCDLFNFSGTVWLEYYSRYATRSFDEELELYDLANADTDGAVENDFDSATQDILANFN